MKRATILVPCLLLFLIRVEAEEDAPIGKVLEMITSLEQKVIAEGQASQKAYEEHAEFCSDRNKELSWEVKDGTSQVDNLKANVAKESADMESLMAKIDDLASAMSTSDKELKKATDLRQGENADFSVVEKELTETIDTIERASAVIAKEMNGGASLAQLQGSNSLLGALQALVSANAVRSDDATKLTVLLQSFSESDDSDEEDEEDEDRVSTGEGKDEDSKGGGILDALEGLQGKAEEQLAKARELEEKAMGNYELKKQALESEMKFGGKDLSEAKKNSAACSERKAGAEGELTATVKDLTEDTKMLEELHKDCMEKAEDFETETTSRNEELKALAQAKKMIKEAVGGGSLAQEQAVLVSFVQEESSSMQTVRMVRRLANSYKSRSIERLATKIENAVQSGTEDPFEKVKTMIDQMIAKLEAEAEAEATQKAFCDKALKEAGEKREDAETAINKLSVKIEQGVAMVAKLSEEVVVLQDELSKTAGSQQKIDLIRADELKVYEADKVEMEQGLAGIKKALQVLKEYYAKSDDGGHAPSSGAGGGIISLLEVCESDFAKSLAEIISAEEAAVTAYTAESNENEISKAAKDKDVEYKQKEIASLQKADTEFKSDRDGFQEQLDAVMEGLRGLEKQCIAKAEGAGEKFAKKKAEIDGLKSALTTLSGGDAGGALVQEGGKSLRGAAQDQDQDQQVLVD